MIKSYINWWPLERASKNLPNDTKEIFLAQTVWVLYKNEYTLVWKYQWKKILWKSKDLLYKIDQKSFIYVFPNDYKWYLVPKKPRQNIATKKIKSIAKNYSNK